MKDIILSSNPQVFVDNKEINEILNTKGIEILPVIMVDGVVVKEGVILVMKSFVNC